MQRLNLKATTYALTALVVLAYSLCVLFRPFFPGWPMYDVTMWQVVFPGFSWTLSGVLTGLAWTVAYAVFSALVFGKVYNFFVGREAESTARHEFPGPVR